MASPDTGWPAPVGPPSPPQPPAVVPPAAVTVAPNNGTLSFTNSAYGGVIPIVYGADRLAGNVIWSSAPNTVTTTVEGGDFTYQTMDFAVALCEGPITGLLRIWVGANLVLDNTILVDDSGIAQPAPDGSIGSYVIDLTDPIGPLAPLPSRVRQTRLTVYTGSATQLPCPILVATDGYELTPAYRGTAYVVFENFLLGTNSVPAVFFEVTAHTSADAPRIYGDFAGAVFTTWRAEMIAFDPSVDRFYFNATKTSPANNGIVVVNANTLEDLGELEIGLLYSIGPMWDTTCVLPLSGLLINSEASANRGILRTFNPLSGGLLYSLGPGGDLSGNYTTGAFTGIAITDAGGVQAFACPVTAGQAAQQDMFVGVGALNRSVGLASVSPAGVITMVAAEAFNGVLPSVNNTIGVMTIVFNATSVTQFQTQVYTAKFYDSIPVWGTHVFGFSCDNNEVVSIKVWRLTVSSYAVLTPAQAVYKQLADISLLPFGGQGFIAGVRAVIPDPGDGTFVLLVEVATRGTYLAKYSPFTGGLLWTTLVPDFPTSVAATQMPSWALLNGNKYCWINASGGISQIDLLTGTVTENTHSMAAQSLPAMTNAMQFYNCYENSITYMTGTADQHITKVFLDRLARTAVPLSAIVTDLVERTGLLPSDILVDDLSLLNVHGYTISSVQSVRQCFSDLGQAFTFDVVESNGKLLFKTRGNGVDLTVSHDLIQGADSSQGNAANADEWLKTTQLNDGSRVRKINLTYRDINMDYASNVQSVILSKYGTQVFDPEAFIDVSVPIALTAAEAVTLAEILIYAKLTYNTTFEFTLAPQALIVDPADVLTITMPNGEDNVTLRLRQVDIGTDNFVKCQASEENADIYTDQIALFGQAGFFRPSRIPPHPARIDPFVLAIPGFDAFQISTTPFSHRYYMAFLNWVPGTLLTDNIDVTIGSQNFSVPAPPHGCTWGIVVTPPNATHAGGGTDFNSGVVVNLIDTAGLQLGTAPGGKADLLASDLVNLCYIAGELFQFVTATHISGNQYLLTELHRGKSGTEGAIGAARAGDKFLLLGDSIGLAETAAVVALDAVAGLSPTQDITVNLHSGNPFQPAFGGSFTSINLRPFLVSDFQWSYASTDAVITWQRSSRTADSTYPDDGSVPPSESVSQPELSETYVLYFYTNPATFNAASVSTYMRAATVVNATTFTYTSAMQTADGFDRTTQTLYCAIQQNGSLTGVDNGAIESHSLPHV